MKVFSYSILRYSIIFFMFFSCKNYTDLNTVNSVDLKKYSGLWYEIASFPQRFQKGCTCTTAEYIPIDENYLIVINRCKKDSINGPEVSIKGKAFVQENSGNAKLKVQFFWPFKGKYWIIELADDYSWAMVGHPNREYLWILARKPKIDPVLYDSLLIKANSKGFDINKLVKTIHPNS